MQCQPQRQWPLAYATSSGYPPSCTSAPTARSVSSPHHRPPNMSSLHDPTHSHSSPHLQGTTFSFKLPLLSLCSSTIQRFVLSRSLVVLSRSLVVLSVRGCVSKLTGNTFNIRFHLFDRFSLRFVRVRVGGGGGEGHHRGSFSAVFLSLSTFRPAFES